MHSHELARILLSLPNLPIATFANNHLNPGDKPECGFGIKVGKSNGCIVIGNFSPSYNGIDHYVEVVNSNELG
jgi:hypothetical protein